MVEAASAATGGPEVDPMAQVALDPTLQAGAAVIDPGDQGNTYIGPKRDIDPRIGQLAVDPSQIPVVDRQAAVQAANKEARLDMMQNRVIVHDQGSEPHWAAEFPNVFTFDKL